MALNNLLLNDRLRSQLEKHIGDVSALPEELSRLFADISDEYDRSSALEQELAITREHVRICDEIASTGRWEYDLTDNEQSLVYPWYASEQVIRILGLGNSNENLTGDLFFSTVHPDDVNKVQSAFTASIASQSDFDVQYRTIHAGGEERIIRARARVIQDAFTGKAIKFAGIVEDLTSVRKSELALAESEIRFRSMIEYSADLVVIISEDHIVKYAHGSLHTTMGFELEEFIGTPSILFMHPDDQVKINEFRKIVLASPGVPMSNTYRRITKDGREIWCEGTATNLLHVPAVNGIVINVKDISKKVEAEMALKANEYKMSSLLRNSSDAITVTDENFKVIFAAESLSAITGFTPEEVHGRSYADFVHPDHKEEVEAYFRKVKESYGDPMKIVYKTRKKDGSYFWAERITVNLLHDPVVRGIVSNYRDVTDRRNYIEALEVTNDNLQKTNMELDKFVYSVSHDLRAPLSSMLGVISVMEAEGLPQSTARDLEFLKSSIKKLDGFILDILNYSKNGRTGLNSESIDFEAKVESILQNLKYMEGRERIAVTTNFKTEGEFISDGSRINVILGNLISNAIRYSDVRRSDSFVEISVSTTPGKAVIRVADNGIGIPADKQSKVYEMFYRLSGKSTGSGLGLYIVKETVEKLKGEMILESEEGKGTVFTVVLPNLENI